MTAMRWGRRGRKLNFQQSIVLIVLVVCLLFLVYLFAYDTVYYVWHSSVSENRLTDVSKHNSPRKKFYKGETKVPSKRTPYRWKQIRDTYDLLDELRNGTANQQQLYRQCESLPVLERLSRSECRAEWMYYLESAEVIGIENMMGFILSKLAGFEVVFKDGRRAMYKPCAGRGEFPENEVRTSHMDYAIGFNRAPVSVTRNFTAKYFMSLAKGQKDSMLVSALDHTMVVLDQIDATCSDNGIFYGTMIGWVDGLRWAKSFPKKLSKTSFEEIEQFRQSDPLYAADVFQNHFMFYMIGITRRIGKNEYDLPSGELMTVDLDRAKWKRSSGNDPSEFSMCYLCKIREKTLEQIQEAAEDDTLAITTMLSLRHDMGKFTFTKHEQRVIDKRLQNFLNQCFNPCIDKYGSHDVIL